MFIKQKDDSNQDTVPAVSISINLVIHNSLRYQSKSSFCFKRAYFAISYVDDDSGFSHFMYLLQKKKKIIFLVRVPYLGLMYFNSPILGN